MSSAIWNTLNHNIASRVRINTTDPLISEPSIFSLVKFLHHQGFDDNVINTTAITELNAKLMAEESRLCAVENSVVAQMQEQLQRLTTMLPATTPLAEIFVARNRAKFSSCRNHTRQAACQAALGALPTPARRSRPTEDAKAVLRQFWDAGTTHPNVEQRIMLACHAHLTFNQVSYWFSNQRNRGTVVSSSSSTSSTPTAAPPRVRVKSKSTRDAERAAAAAANASTSTAASTTFTFPPPAPPQPLQMPSWPPEPPAALPGNADDVLLAAFQHLDTPSWPTPSSSNLTTTTEVDSSADSSPFVLLDEPSILKLLDDSALTNINVLDAIDEAQQSSMSSPTVVSPAEFRSAYSVLNSVIFISSDDGMISEASDQDVVEMLKREHEFWDPSQ